MKPKTFTAILLFISAYSPLFLILAVKDFDFENTYRFKHPIADYILLATAALSILLLFITVNNIKRGNMAVKVKALKSRSLDTINYTIPYLFSAFDIDLSKIEDIITISLFLIILLILTLTSQSVFVNPLLALNGYSFYDLEYEFDGKRDSTVVISKLDLQVEKQYYIRSLTRFLYFVTEKNKIEMTLRSKFKNLKNLNLKTSDVTLAIVREYKRDRVSHYNVAYVKIDIRLEKRLRNIVIRTVQAANTFEPYEFDCPEPEGDQVRGINSDATDFYRIYENLQTLNPEENVINSVDELLKAKAYLIILRDLEGIQAVGFKTLPENWKMKKNKGLIPLLYRENRFEDLEDENVFSISGIIDVIHHDEALFILSKKDFEMGLNFRDGMIAKAKELYQEVKKLKLFVNLDILTNKVGNNQRYLRKMATIKNLGYYQDANYLTRLREVSEANNWGIEFQNDQIVITEGNLEAVLTVLQNKRLHSKLTDETFDVDSAKKLEVLG